MHLDINFLFTMPIVVIVYVIFRILGKVIGVYIGGKISRSDSVIRKYLGLALFPQAGIAIGLVLSLNDELGFEQIAPIMLNTIIATTMVHELLGPIFTTYVVKLSGDARAVKESKKSR
jgi:Kef-type K+ transport system membrane component KefB